MPAPDQAADRTAESSAPAWLGVVAVVAVVLCCALPVLVGAGALAAAGGFLDKPVVIAAGAGLAVGALAWSAHRRRRGRTPCSSPDGSRSDPSTGC